jgi:phosphoserine phosphatase
MHQRQGLVAVLFWLFCSLPLLASAATPKLASWNDGAARNAILDFVARVTDKSSADFVPPSQRIAVFDNDGTLWAEKPAYFQLFFAIDRIKELAPQHPEWKHQQPFKGVLEGDLETALAGGEKAILELVMASHADMSTDEFERIVETWIGSARHPKTQRLYTEMVYQPMLELLNYLRAHGFKTYIVSGGGVEFMRVFAERVYGVPPEQVIGSGVKTRFEARDEGFVLLRLPEIDFINDKGGKPVGIQRHIGRRPIAAFGNSDGDMQMLQWVAPRKGTGFGLLVHHTDAEREWAYDRKSPVGKLDKAIAEAGVRAWTLVDMKNDWKRVFSFAGP